MVASEYRHIAAWGKLMQSNQSYVESQQAKALRDGAPIDAVYFAEERRPAKWITIGECAEGTQARIAYILKAGAQ